MSEKQSWRRLNVTETPTKKVEISEQELATLKTDRDKALNAAEDSKKALEALRRKREQPKKPTQDEHPSASTEGKQTSSPPAPPDPHAGHGHEDGKPHYIGAWQQFCPTCGDKNPNFKDETECEDCHAHLGSKEVAEKLKACPNCGGHRAKKL